MAKNHFRLSNGFFFLNLNHLWLCLNDHNLRFSGWLNLNDVFISSDDDFRLSFRVFFLIDPFRRPCAWVFAEDDLRFGLGLFGNLAGATVSVGVEVWSVIGSAVFLVALIPITAVKAIVFVRGRVARPVTEKPLTCTAVPDSIEIFCVEASTEVLIIRIPVATFV